MHNFSDTYICILPFRICVLCGFFIVSPFVCVYRTVEMVYSYSGSSHDVDVSFSTQGTERWSPTHSQNYHLL